MKKNAILLFICSIFCLSINAQSIVLDEEVDVIEEEYPSYGANGKTFMFSYVGWSFIIADKPANRMPLSTVSSGGWQYGFGVKYRMTGLLSSGWGLEYNSLNFRIKQIAGKTFPDTLMHDKQSFSLGSLGGNVFLRINFDPKRGNTTGRYIDFCGYYDWNVIRTLRQKDETVYGEINRTNLSRVRFMNSYSYGAMVRLGRKSLNVYARYRLSDIFKHAYYLPELPRLTVGISFSPIPQ